MLVLLDFKIHDGAKQNYCENTCIISLCESFVYLCLFKKLDKSALYTLFILESSVHQISLIPPSLPKRFLIGDEE